MRLSARLRYVAASAAAALALAPGAGAQGEAAAGAAPVEDPFEAGAVYVEADEVFDDQENGRYVASGSVEARYGDRVIRAEEVIYYPAENRVLAAGGVVLEVPPS